MQSVYGQMCHLLEFHNVWFSDHIALRFCFTLYQTITLQQWLRTLRDSI